MRRRPAPEGHGSIKRNWPIARFSPDPRGPADHSCVSGPARSTVWSHPRGPADHRCVSEPDRSKPRPAPPGASGPPVCQRPRQVNGKCGESRFRQNQRVDAQTVARRTSRHASAGHHSCSDTLHAAQDSTPPAPSCQSQRLQATRQAPARTTQPHARSAGGIGPSGTRPGASAPTRQRSPRIRAAGCPENPREVRPDAQTVCGHGRHQPRNTSQLGARPTISSWARAGPSPNRRRRSGRGRGRSRPQ